MAPGWHENFFEAKVSTPDGLSLGVFWVFGLVAYFVCFVLLSVLKVEGTGSAAGRPGAGLPSRARLEADAQSTKDPEKVQPRAS